MHRRTWWALLAWGLTADGPALAWGTDGHRAVAAVAMQGLAPAARKAVAELVPDGDLVSVATWADDLRALERHDFMTPEQTYIRTDPDALAFLPHDPNHPPDHPARQPLWHFTDTPIGAARWQAPPVESDDVVTLIRRCERVLTATEPPPGEFITRRQAIRFLVHYVGDVHQPLHASNGFWDLAGDRPVLLHPADAAHAPAGAFNDRGGNDLYYTATLNYHHLWDTALVKLAAGEKESEPGRVPVGPDAPFVRELARRSGGGEHHWQLVPGEDPADWATHSLSVANGLYAEMEGLELGKSKHGKDPRDGIDLPRGFVNAAYKRKQVPVVQDQLAAAGFHLAALLNRIWPDR